MAEIKYMVEGVYIKDFGKLAEDVAVVCGAEIVAVERISNGAVVCLEKYFFRKEGYAALTIIVENESERSRATIIGSGGGEGFFNISYGTNSDFVNSAAEALYSCYEFGYKKE